MQFEITDEAAIIFAQEFYGAIADSYPLEAALAEARGAIRDAGNPTEWGTPVLYSRAPDGHLFHLTGKAQVADIDRSAREETNRKATDEADRRAWEEVYRRAREEADRKARDETKVGVQPGDPVEVNQAKDRVLRTDRRATNNEPKQFKLPDVGEGLTEADIVTWYVKPGDHVSRNQVIVEIETAKALLELPSPWDGVVVELLVPEGRSVEVGTPIISIATS